MRPPCAPLPAACGAVSSRVPPIRARGHSGHDRVAAQEEHLMDIAAIFRSDRSRVVADIGCETAGNIRELRHKTCHTRRMRSLDSLRLAIVSSYGINRVATEGEQQMDLTTILRSDRCRGVLRKSPKNPGNSGKGQRSKKKNPRMRPFQGAKAWENAYSGWPNRSRLDRIGVDNGRSIN